MALIFIFYFIFYILPLFNYSEYAGILSFFNIVSYLAFAFSIYQLRNWIFNPQFYPKEKISRNLFISGSFIVFTNLLFLFDGISRSIPEFHSFYITYYLGLTLPLLIHGCFFVLNGLFIRIRSIAPDLLHFSLKIRRKIWKVKRTSLSKFVVVVAISIIFVSTILIGNTAILKYFRYNENYEINNGNPEILIKKAESFNYTLFLIHRDLYGILHSIPNDKNVVANYIDRDYIEYQKELMRKDLVKIHWFFGYRYAFNYWFEANLISTINLTYKEDIIIKAQYDNLEDIFTVEQSYFLPWDSVGYWYINLSLIPYSVNKTSILLNNSFLIKMVIKYDHSFSSLGAVHYQIDQYLVLDENYQIICICIPKFGTLVA